MDRKLKLPIDEVLPKLGRCLEKCKRVLLKAPTGAGKTTRVARWLVEKNVIKQGRVLLVEPRRIAARSAALRMADERGENVGHHVGYHVRFEKKISPNTKIVALTEGMLIRYLQADPLLENVSAVLFDEFHERNLWADVGLAMIRRVVDDVRPDLMVAVMSATLDAGQLQAFWPGTPLVESQGRLHPISISYLPRPTNERLEDLVWQHVPEMMQQTPGDLLTFLPGKAEIRRSEEKLRDWAHQQNVELMILHGEMAPADQQRVLKKRDRRKVVLATNVAETSITIDGITGVMDTGWARVKRFRESVGLDGLQLERISKASADQRAGRAGRQQPGHCLRLWAASQQTHLPDHVEPEIHRADLAEPLLQLRAWGEADVKNFPWFEPPLPNSLHRAEQLLEILEATESGKLTDLGRQLAELPMHPRLGRLLLAGQRLGISALSAWAAALLSERDILMPGVRPPSVGWNCDLAGRHQLAQQRHSNQLRPAGVSAIKRAQKQFLQLLSDQSKRDARENLDVDWTDDDFEKLSQALLAGFPDRVAKFREGADRASGRGVLVGGRGVELAGSSGLSQRPLENAKSPELFLALDVNAQGAESRVRLGSAIKADWLDARWCQTVTELEFDADRQRVRGYKRDKYLDLVLRESPAPIDNPAKAGEILAQAARQHWPAGMDLQAKEFSNYRKRLLWLGSLQPHLQLPQVDDQGLQDLLNDFCMGCVSFGDLKKKDWKNFIGHRLSYEQRQALDRLAPESASLPGGKSKRLEYRDDGPPILAARIQELFGVSQTPTVAGGQMKVLVHLLAPNGRPQQVTDDLASFWANTYAQVRKDLRGRYPKHAWPENPMQNDR